MEHQQPEIRVESNRGRGLTGSGIANLELYQVEKQQIIIQSAPLSSTIHVHDDTDDDDDAPDYIFPFPLSLSLRFPALFQFSFRT